MNKYYLFSTGCIRRALDLMLISSYLQKNGWSNTTNPKKADLLIVATCGVVEKNEEHSLMAVRKVEKASKQNATVVITGCLPKINPDAINSIGAFVFVPSGELHKLDSIISATVPLKDVGYPDTAKNSMPIVDFLVARSFCRKIPFYRAMFERFAVSDLFLRFSVILSKFLSVIKIWNKKKIIPYYNIKIADGCLSSCTFCATKLAIGSVKSRPVEMIHNEFQRGVSSGYKVFQLVSEDTACYGMDIGTDLSALIERLCSVPGDYKIIIIDCNPHWLNKQRDRLIPLLVGHQERIKELYITVQSGSDNVLRLMNREYTSAEAVSLLKEINVKAPRINIRTSMLVGFPGETDADHEATKRLIKEINFTEVNINRYEDRPATASSKMSNKIDHMVIENRARDLVESCNCRLLS